MDNQNTITSEDLKSSPEMALPTPPANDYLDSLNSIVGANEAISSYTTANQALNDNQAKVEKDVNKVSSLSSLLLGKEADTATANETSGLNKYTEELRNLGAQSSALVRESQAIPLQIQEQFKNTGATDAGVAPIQTGRLRENAIRALTLAQAADIASANWAAAKDKAQRTVDLKYKPIEQEIATLKEQLLLNKEFITDPLEKKRAEKLNFVLNERTRLLAEKKDKEKKVEDEKIKAKELAFTLQKNGAPQKLIDKALSANSVEEIQKIAGVTPFLRTQGELLDDKLKEMQIKKINFDMQEARAKRIADAKAVTPAQQKKIDDELKAEQLKKAQLVPLKEKLDLINTIKNSKGLNSRVGTKSLVRKGSGKLGTALGGAATGAATGAFGGPIGAIIGGVVGLGAGLYAGNPDDITGVGYDFASSVQQLTNQETLSQLLELKAAGGTLGAVSEKELDLLQKAASKINSWEIKDPKTGIGTGQWRVSEKLFNEELDKLQRSSEALYKSLGGFDPGSPEEAAKADEFTNIVEETLLSPDAIYSNAGYNTN